MIATSGPVDALERVKMGEAQLAVAKSDGRPRTACAGSPSFHNDPVVIVTPGKTKIEDFGGLTGKTLGVIGPPSAVRADGICPSWPPMRVGHCRSSDSLRAGRAAGQFGGSPALPEESVTTIQVAT